MRLISFFSKKFLTDAPGKTRAKAIFSRRRPTGDDNVPVDTVLFAWHDRRATYRDAKPQLAECIGGVARGART